MTDRRYTDKPCLCGDPFCAGCVPEPITKDPRPAFYPCGCSRHKVDAGRCDQYQPGEMPSVTKGPRHG